MRPPMRIRTAIVPPLVAWAAGWLMLTAPAAAQTGLVDPASFSGIADIRLVAADGEPSWTDRGFGKLRFGGTSEGEWKPRPIAAEAALVWQPRFSWSIAGKVSMAAQHEQDTPVDLVEAYLTARPLPGGATRISARAGLYWPEISLEHEGPAWSVADMITPSAINSWIGEEVKVIGAEGTIERQLGGGHVSASAGLFGFNDTAGTLIAFRGWALHDKKATAFGQEKLPPLNDFMRYAQAPDTRPLIEIDDRPGFYGRIELALAVPARIGLFYYDNRADPQRATPELQWGWHTRFWALGARLDAAPDTWILAQALAGTTEMGIETDEEYWVETRFRAAYARISHRVGDVTISGRIELFDTRERGNRMEPSESEDGWAATGAVSWAISPHVQLLGEVLRVDSDRGTRSRVGLAPEQRQTLVQTALRLTF